MKKYHKGTEESWKEREEEHIESLEIEPQALKSSEIPSTHQQPEAQSPQLSKPQSPEPFPIVMLPRRSTRNRKLPERFAFHK